MGFTLVSLHSLLNVSGVLLAEGIVVPLLLHVEELHSVLPNGHSQVVLLLELINLRNACLGNSKSGLVVLIHADFLHACVVLLLVLAKLINSVTEASVLRHQGL